MDSSQASQDMSTIKMPSEHAPVGEQKKNPQETMSSKVSASKDSASRRPRNDLAPRTKTQQNNSSATVKTEHSPKTGTTTESSVTKEQASLRSFTMFFVILLVSIFILHEMQSRMYQFVLSIADYFLMVIGYYFFLSVLNFDILNLVAEQLLKLFEVIIPFQLLDCWVFPTDDGFEFGDTNMLEALEVIWQTVLVIGFTLGMKWICNKVVRSAESTSEIIDYDLCLLHIGAFDQGPERDYIMYLDPSRARSPSETAAYVLEGGLRRGGPRQNTSPEKQTTIGSPSNPAYPLLVDFAGAGYGKIIAKNKRQLDMDNEGTGPKNSPPPTPTRPRLNRSLTPFTSANDSQAGREERRNQMESLGMECSMLERWMEQQRSLSGTYDEELEPKMRKHYQDEAARRGEGSSNKMEQAEVDEEEAAIREAFPNFTSIVESRGLRRRKELEKVGSDEAM